MKWILLLLVIAGVAGYFTRPEEAAMRERADTVLSDSAQEAAGNLNVPGAVEAGWAAINGDRAYNNYLVAAKYTVTLDGQPVVNCWGAFQQVQCSRAADPRTGG
jgi:hypothetical protein